MLVLNVFYKEPVELKYSLPFSSGVPRIKVLRKVYTWSHLRNPANFPATIFTKEKENRIIPISFRILVGLIKLLISFSSARPKLVYYSLFQVNSKKCDMYLEYVLLIETFYNKKSCFLKIKEDTTLIYMLQAVLVFEQLNLYKWILISKNWVTLHLFDVFDLII